MIYHYIKKLTPLFITLLSLNALAYDTSRTFQASTIPHELKGITIDEKLGASVNLNLKFKDENGKTVSLKDYTKESKPVLFTIIYYLCPNLCQLHLNGLMKVINELKLESTNFEFVALSMDHTEKPPLAKKKKQSYTSHFQMKDSQHIHLLTGHEKNIRQISSEVGFNFKWNEKQKQYAHLPVAYVLTPEGKISRYIYGIEMDEKTIRLALTEASDGRIGGIVERILLFCFQFDPRKNRYTLYAYNLMKAGGILMMILLILMLAPTWLRKQDRD